MWCVNTDSTTIEDRRKSRRWKPIHNDIWKVIMDAFVNKFGNNINMWGFPEQQYFQIQGRVLHCPIFCLTVNHRQVEATINGVSAQSMWLTWSKNFQIDFVNLELDHLVNYLWDHYKKCVFKLDAGADIGYFDESR